MNGLTRARPDTTIDDNSDTTEITRRYEAPPRTTSRAVRTVHADPS